MLPIAMIIHFCIKCCRTFIWTAEDFLVCLTRGEHMAKIKLSFRFWRLLEGACQGKGCRCLPVRFGQDSPLHV